MNLAKKILLIVFTFLIVAVFGLWGMGDVFSSRKNIVAEVGNEKIYTQDYINESRIYAQKYKKNILGDNDHFVILNTLITQKIYENYSKDQGLIVSDNALAYYLKNNDQFKDDKGKFSRVKYEKYLLENNLNAATLEFFLKKDLIKNIAFKSYLSGISVPTYHLNKLKENFLKTIEVDFYKVNKNNNISKENIKDHFNKNKSEFSLGEIRGGFTIELSPQNLGFIKSNDEYYQTLNELENIIIENKNFDEIIKKFNFKPLLIEKMNIEGKNLKRVLSSQNKYASSLFTLTNNISTDIFEIDNKKILINLKSNEEHVATEVDEYISSEIKLKIKKKQNFEHAKKLLTRIKTNKNEFLNYALKNKLQIENMIFKNISDNKKLFSQSNMESIFKQKINDSIILTEKENVYLMKIKKFRKSESKIDNIDQILKSQIIEEFKSLISRDFDAYLIKKYPVEINTQALEEVKKSI